MNLKSGDNMLLKWSPLMEVGLTEIDADHRLLFELLNRVHEASDRPDQGPVMAILRELGRHTELHFGREEDLMAQCNYASAEFHRHEHRELFRQIKNYMDELNAGRLVASSVALFMQRWLLQHIAGADRELCAMLREYRKAGSA